MIGGFHFQWFSTESFFCKINFCLMKFYFNEGFQMEIFRRFILSQKQLGMMHGVTTICALLNQNYTWNLMKKTDRPKVEVCFTHWSWWGRKLNYSKNIVYSESKRGWVSLFYKEFLLWTFVGWEFILINVLKWNFFVYFVLKTIEYHEVSMVCTRNVDDLYTT